MKASIRYIHRISPRSTDVEGPYPITASDLATVDAAAAWVGKVSQGWTGKPRTKNARRAGAGWVFFPRDQAGNWHSITIVVEE